MKNFPHQINDLNKLTAALNVANVLIGSKKLLDDETFGEALARAEIYTFRNKELSVAKNLALQRTKDPQDQGFQVAARDIKRFFRLADLLSSDGKITARGADILKASGPLRNALWRDAMLQLALSDSAGNISHPYRLMLQLVSDHPKIETPKLLLALEARDDGAPEYARISALAKKSTQSIIETLKISESSARNATKILPGIAEQVGDISRKGGNAILLEHAVTTEDALFEEIEKEYEKTVPSTPTAVDADTIATLPNFGSTMPTTTDLSAAIELRKRRTIEHQNTVTSLATVLSANGYSLYKGVFDCLGFKKDIGGLLVEVKTLDGSRADERRQSEKALGQLRGYNFFNVPEEMKKPKFVEMIGYSAKPSDAAIEFMLGNTICSAWREHGDWVTANLDGRITNFSPDKLF